MKAIVRRALVGLVCGAASSVFLFSVVKSVELGLALGALFWDCSNFRVLRPGKGFDYRSRDDLRCARLGPLDRHQCYPVDDDKVTFSHNQSMFVSQ
jgi:hypothetical protein